MEKNKEENCLLKYSITYFYINVDFNLCYITIVIFLI